MTIIIETRYKTSDGDILPGKTYEGMDEDTVSDEVDEAFQADNNAALLDGLTVEGAEISGENPDRWITLAVPPHPLSEGGFWRDIPPFWLDKNGLLDWPWIIITLLSLIALAVAVLSI